MTKTSSRRPAEFYDKHKLENILGLYTRSWNSLPKPRRTFKHFVKQNATSQTCSREQQYFLREFAIKAQISNLFDNVSLLNRKLLLFASHEKRSATSKWNYQACPVFLRIPCIGEFLRKYENQIKISPISACLVYSAKVILPYIQRDCIPTNQNVL